MEPTNGAGVELGQALERIVAAFSRINTALRTLLDRLHRMSEFSEASSERREREHDKALGAIGDLEERVIMLSANIAEALDRIKEVRRDQSDPNFRTLNPALYPIPLPAKKDDTGKLVAFARLAENIPTPWVLVLVKVFIASTLGALCLRGLQWMMSGR